MAEVGEIDLQGGKLVVSAIQAVLLGEKKPGPALDEAVKNIEALRKLK